MPKAALILLLFVASGPGRAWADDPVKPVNVDSARRALHGFDAVAYFTENRAVEGSARFEHEWNGAIWRFASAANRDRFAGDPERYAPQFGGYCAWAVSRAYTADIDPAAFAVVDGRLYLNYSKLIQRRWQLDRAANIRKGETNWPKLSGQPAAKGVK
jgi:hypothetical protein